MSSHEHSQFESDTLYDLPNHAVKLKIQQRQNALPNPIEWNHLEPIACERLKFDYEIQALLDRKNESGTALWAFLKRELRQFHLDRFHQEASVFNEAYIRGVAKIESGETIRNVSAWMRGTSFHVIRELHRKKQKSCSLDESSLEIPAPPVTLEEMKGDIEITGIAMQLLSPEDQLLLHLKIAQNLSWRCIREILIAEGCGEFSESTLRKRKERALARLRTKFYALKPLES